MGRLDRNFVKKKKKLVAIVLNAVFQFSKLLSFVWLHMARFFW
jgi:hypothetical protein